MVESVQILLPTIPVNVQVNLWGETANRVSIAIGLHLFFKKKKKLLFSMTETTTEYCRNI